MTEETVRIKELVLAGQKARFITLRAEGAVLTKRTWTAGAETKAKETSKTCATAAACRSEFDKAVRAKQREFYATVRPHAAAGQVVHESFAPGGGGGAVLDLAPDGRSLLTASITSESSFGSKLHLIDVATGARTIVAEHPGGDRQQFLLAALFDYTGRNVFYTLNAETWWLALDTGERTRLSAGDPARLNPHVVRPFFDRDRTRLVVFAENGGVRVLDRARSIVAEVSTVSPTTECRAAALSPSGRLLALYIVSRGRLYGHEDAKHDTSSFVQIWDLDESRLVRTLPFAEKLDQLHFSPGEDDLIVTWDYRQGPVGIDLATGEERWRFEASPPTDRLATAYCIARSPDGTLLAVGRNELCLYRNGSKEPLELEETGVWGEVGRVIFSADGSLVAFTQSGSAFVRRVP